MEVIISAFILINLYWTSNAISSDYYFSNKEKTKESRCHQANERYLVIPPPPFASQDDEGCTYYECDNTRYIKRTCQKGQAVSRKYKKRSGYPGRLHPCITSSLTPCGLRDEIKRPEVNLCGMDLVIVMDMSCSIAEKDKLLMIKFVQNLISKFRISALNVKVAGVTYAGGVHNIQTFQEGRNRAITQNNFDRMVTKDNNCHTVTNEALELIRDVYLKKEQGSRKNYPKVMMIFSDGKTFKGKKIDSEVLSNKTIEVGKSIRDMGVLSLVVGIPGRNKKLSGYHEWLGIAGTEKNIFVAESAERLNMLQEKVLHLAETTCSSNPKQ
ncbi:unnamed protein product [Owenia fusiformis]|uniref:VWFA domain-containing protein n=1 Tax=Owenia fusiformis TaxID=6347 RepID=A0A8S4PRV5_OWEFU|nr:unnamed protein product [Owenia fusiformis]